MALTETQRKLHERTRRTVLDDVPELDAHEHVGLLTVVAGLRPVALFLGIAESDGRALAALLHRFGLTPLLASGPTTAYTWDSPYRPEITDLFRRRDESPVLWVCRNSEPVHSIEKGMDQIAGGRLLGYPPCCIAAQQREKANFETAVIRGYIRAFGDHLQGIHRALIEGRKVEIEWEDDNRVPETIAAFPFVQHIACRECLNTEGSPTGMLNSPYGDLVAEADPALYDYLIRVAR